MMIVYPVPNTAISPVDTDIRLIFFSKAFDFAYGGALFSVFAHYTHVSFATYCPTFFIRDYMMVPGSALFDLSPAFKKDFQEVDVDL